MKLVIVLVHLCVCAALILIVLLQKGKGAGMGAAFGGSSQTVFGSAGATPFLHKVTVGAAFLFMVTSLFLAVLMGTAASPTRMKGAAQQTEQVPVAPPPEAPAPAEGEKR